MFVVRNPIQRALSAFNWRNTLVVETGHQRDRFPGEFEILRKYGTLNNLAERLYTDGGENRDVISAFRSIHHLKESISFYLDSLLEHLTPRHVFAVLTTEFLDEEIPSILKVDDYESVHRHRQTRSTEQLQLSELATKNLARVLTPDYNAIRRLLALHEIPEPQQAALLFGELKPQREHIVSDLQDPYV